MSAFLVLAERPVFDGHQPLPTVRLAGLGDAPALYDCLLALEADNAMVPRSEDRVWAEIRRCCTCRGGVAGIIEENGVVVASAGVVLSDLTWYSDAPCLREIWLFVRPEHRAGGRLADALWAFMERHRDEMRALTGVPDLQLITGPTSANRLPAKMRLWGNRGRLIGATYVMAP